MAKGPKQIRHFHCFTDLWEAYEQLAEARDCSIDALLNEALRAYMNPPAHDATLPRAKLSPDDLRTARPTLHSLPAMAPDGDEPAEEAPRRPRLTREHRLRSPTTTNQTPVPAADQKLYLVVGGDAIVVNTKRFIIGRDKQANLALQGTDISRMHAAIVRGNRGFAIVDLGSTNGIYWEGERIQNKQVEEGDVFQIGDHELRCSYREPDQLAKRRD